MATLICRRIWTEDHGYLTEELGGISYETGWRAHRTLEALAAIGSAIAFKGNHPMEKTFTLSVAEAQKWLETLSASGHVPTWLMAAVLFLRTIKGKKLQISVRAVDE